MDWMFLLHQNQQQLDTHFDTLVEHAKNEDTTPDTLLATPKFEDTTLDTLLDTLAGHSC